MGGPIPLAPAQLVVEEASKLLRNLGHENHGSLSYDRGFLPTRPMPLSLPEQWSAWDRIVADLPIHYRDLTLRKAVEHLPQLDPAELPDEYLQRANALLGTLAHAMWHIEPSHPTEIPSNIALPWEQLRHRLGRPGPVISYLELIVANWRMLDESHPDPFSLQNLRLNITTVDNPEEHRFYLLQTRVLALGAPLIGLTVRAQDAVLADNPAALTAVLEEMKAPLKAVAEALRSLDPRPKSKNYLHPISWAKTVAPFGVPMEKGLLGPSGTSSPLFALIDGLLGRRTHHSFLGKEMMQLRAGYPILWRCLLSTLDEVRIDEYVRNSGSARMNILYDDLRDGYAGPNGFLGRHRRKVQAFLEIAFKVGRMVTIGGFSGKFKERAWDEIDDELEMSRLERCPRNQQMDEISAVSPPAERLIPFSEVAQHHAAESAWCVIRGAVYDLTAFIARHPGGPNILGIHMGRDATHGFSRSHGGPFESKSVGHMLKKMRIGTLLVPSFTDNAFEELYRAWRGALDLLTEMRTALVLDHELQDIAITSAQANQDIKGDAKFRTLKGKTTCTWQIQRGLESHLRFLKAYLEPILCEVLPKLQDLMKACGTNVSRPVIELPEDWLFYLQTLMSAGPPVEAWRDQVPNILQYDTEFLCDITEKVRSGLVELERNAANTSLSALTANIDNLRNIAFKYVELVGELRVQSLEGNFSRFKVESVCPVSTISKAKSGSGWAFPCTQIPLSICPAILTQSVASDNPMLQEQ